MANPEDLLFSNAVDFMQNNVVIPPEGGNYFSTAGKKFVSLLKSAKTARHKERTEIAGTEVRVPIYSLVPTGRGGTGMVEVYWCPYKDNTLCNTTVGNAANLMFTAGMNGCTFGIGSATPDGTRRVAHINLKTQQNMREKQRFMMGQLKYDDGLVDPDIYMLEGNDPVIVTVVGVRNPKTSQWAFYYQRTKLGVGQGGFSHELLDLTPVV